MQDNATSLLEIVGVLCVLVAAFAVDWRLGLAVSGVLLTVIGYLLGKPSVEEPQ